MLINQVSVFMENKPGRAAAVAEVLGKAGINIRAMSLNDTARFGVMHLILDRPDAGFEALKNAHMTISMTEVLAVRMGDTPGNLNRVLQALAAADLNVEYSYAYVTPIEGTAAVILRVEQGDETALNAEKVLADAGITLLTPEEVYR